MRIGIIYKVTSPSKKSYFGRSINSLSKRKYHHLTSARNGSELYLHRAIRKYGGCNFIWEIIEKIKNEDKEDLIDILNEKEIGYIKKYNTLSPNGYNLTKGGGNYGGNGETLGRKQPLDEIRRRAESNRGKKRTEESKNKIRNSLLGIKHTKERRINQSKAHKGKQKGKDNPAFVEIPYNIQKEIIDLHVNHRWGSRKLEIKFNYTYSKILRFLKKEGVYAPIY